MSPIKWLNNLLFIENILGIYRNYCSQRKIKKCFIIFQIFAQTMFHTILLIDELYLLFGNVSFTTQQNLIYVGFAVSVYITAVPPIIFGICYSHAFKSYFRSISRVSECFKKDKKLTNSLKKIYWLSIIYFLSFVVFGVFRAVEVLLSILISDYELILIPILASHTILKFSISFQYLMFFVVMIVVHLTKCLTSLISAVQERVGSCDVSSDEQCIITTEQIQGWVELYQDLANCCEKVTLCFGCQFLFSLISVLAYYVLLTYQICYISPTYNRDTTEYRSVAIIIFSYFSVMMMPFVAAQKAYNQGVKFRRVIARIYNTIIITSSGEAEMKLIKEFIRLIKKNPLEIKLSNKIPAGMYMLPVIITLAVNYLIVMLQFMHVI